MWVVFCMHDNWQLRSCAILWLDVCSVSTILACCVLSLARPCALNCVHAVHAAASPVGCCCSAEVEQLTSLSLRGDATLQEYMSHLKVGGVQHQNWATAGRPRTMQPELAHWRLACIPECLQ
jgi:hypothetical protein